MAIQSDDSGDGPQSDSDSDEIVVRKKPKASQGPTAITAHEALKPKPTASQEPPAEQNPQPEPKKPQPEPKKRRFVNDSDDDSD
jgi:hypothetical protein